MENISEDIKMSSTIRNTTDGIIADIAQCKSNTIIEIEGIVATSQAKCAGHIVSMNQTHTTIMKNLQDYRDGAVIDFALFQKNYKAI